ncbi:MAG: class I SAM-dependent methyltransferase [Gammaproteobacteria bacterium]|nr:class I SAM-dependent methyltransferase [Gammaproteobacteria bacterium]
MMSREPFKPDVMPVDRAEWRKQLNLSNFINAYYQYRDLTSLTGSGNVLLIGPGQGLDVAVLQWQGYNVTTFDIDETFEPDIIGSVHDLSIFDDQQFDVVIASHVLEHLPVRFLDESLAEISRVSRYAIIYLPVNGRHLQIRLRPGIMGFYWTFGLDIINFFRRPSGEVPEFMSGQHFWEVGLPGFKKCDIKKRMSKQFIVKNIYRNQDWLPSLNFILCSKQAMTKCR